MFLPKTNSVLFNHLKSDLIIYSRFSNQSNNIRINKAYYSDLSKNTAEIRRGSGGRSSFSGVVATVFGATGFLGKYVVNELGKIGSQVIIPYRSAPHSVSELRVMGDLGQMLFLPFTPNDDECIRSAVKYSNVVINLIGKDTQTKNFPHEKVHIDMAAQIARICKEMGVQKLIHMSALHASPNVPHFVIKSGSSYLRTKGLGEIEVMREFPDAIIIKPTDMYGHVDRFLMYYTKFERRIGIFTKNYLPLWKKGKQTIKQPVFAGDVAKAIANAVLDSSCKKTTFEALGPYRYRLDHLVWWILMSCRFSPGLISITDLNPLIIAKIKFYEKIKPIYPTVSMERLEREFHTDTSSGLPSLEDLGITTLTNLEDRMFYEIRFRRRENHYWDALGEIPDVPSPPRSVL